VRRYDPLTHKMQMWSLNHEIHMRSLTQKSCSTLADATDCRYLLRVSPAICVSQCVAVCCSALHESVSPLTFVCCSVLQYVCTCNWLSIVAPCLPYHSCVMRGSNSCGMFFLGCSYTQSTNTCIHIYIYMCIYTQIHPRVHINIHVRTSIHTHIYIKGNNV